MCSAFIGNIWIKNLRFVTSLANLFVDATSTSIYRAILRGHDGFDRALALHISSKAGNLGNEDDHLVNH